MSDSDWPPEGTRVRVKMPAGDFDGVLRERYENDELDDGDYHWVLLDIGVYWAFERHEIEVIDEQRTKARCHYPKGEKDETDPT